MGRRVAGVLVVVAAACAALLPGQAAWVERYYARGWYPVVQRGVTAASNAVPFALLDLLIVASVVGGALAAARMLRAPRGTRVRMLAHRARVESKRETPAWTLEKVSFEAAYGGERVLAWLFLPKNAPPPYQTVIYFPGSAPIYQPSSEHIDTYYEYQGFLSFIVNNGRAVLFPVYKGTFERRNDRLAELLGNGQSWSTRPITSPRPLSTSGRPWPGSTTTWGR